MCKQIVVPFLQKHVSPSPAETTVNFFLLLMSHPRVPCFQAPPRGKVCRSPAQQRSGRRHFAMHRSRSKSYFSGKEHCGLHLPDHNAAINFGSTRHQDRDVQELSPHRELALQDRRRELYRPREAKESYKMCCFLIAEMSWRKQTGIQS